MSVAWGLPVPTTSASPTWRRSTCWPLNNAARLAVAFRATAVLAAARLVDSLGW